MSFSILCDVVVVVFSVAFVVILLLVVVFFFTASEIYVYNLHEKIKIVFL